MKYLHTMLRVTNLELSLEFYCACLGMAVISRNDYPEGRFTLVMLTAPGDEKYARECNAPLLELTFNWDPEQYTEGRNFGHLAYQVENIYHTCKKLMEKDITINRPPRDGHMAFIRSPDNISIELLQKGKALKIQEPWCSMQNSGIW